MLRRSWNHARSLLTNGYFWGGLLLLGFLTTGLYVAVDAWLMPAYTRQAVAIPVPDVSGLPFDEAKQRLAERQLQAERQDQRFNPNVPLNAVVDQRPPARTPVKPGRRIYLTVNSGTVPTVHVPSVVGISLREAQNRMRTMGLHVDSMDVQPDSIPSPDPNTVTRQEPEGGETVPQGTHVQLWYSTGLGQEYVIVPDVAGMNTDEARRYLLDQMLRSVVIGEDGAVRKQSPEPGTRVREGSQIRLFTQ